ncbi:Grx4 family monothiol glutaredoxin [Polyangium jinanense]|uniref:Probable monothiol glutaredoxin 2 n=1 Tax=Polyangium jinanense TaxID=2829994 RepID=A0A9X4AUV6_9BACT|nr:Grx4 family monothiol glutaredoxin [Polyangium jinanense]MDC3958156.1 Grx4 family monothiol glutaredoxin [Polyangium jinanense]MDC3983645.1 Grx4 family monothiol glutaredoxin [Polyangium jinanense]
MNLSEPLKQRIEALVRSDRVVLFMKGSRRFPQCGFSSSVVQILDEVLPSYTTVNVLEDPEIREGIKAYASWPTIPQLYIDGEFVGGADIVREMRESGELAQKLGAAGAGGEAKALKITLSASAKRAFDEAAKEAPGELLRFEVSPRFEYGLYFGPRAEGDIEVDAGGITVLVDKGSARRADGVSIDFVDGPEGAGFKIENPNEPPRVRQLSVKKLKEMLDAGETFELIDVRTDKERAIARIAQAKLLDQAELERLEALPKDTPIVFHCHHGGRSRSAAEAFVGRGFSKVYNLEGGIDAWSVVVDTSVPRY